MKSKTIAYHYESIPQTSPSLCGPCETKRIEDYPPEDQQRWFSLKPPRNQNGELHKRPVAGNRDNKRQQKGRKRA